MFKLWLSLWLRVYALMFIIYQVLALLGVVLVAAASFLWGSGGYGLVSLAGTYLLLVIPAGFGVTFVASIPVAIAWFGVARVMGWPIAPRPRPMPQRCHACGYERTGLGDGSCPECGAPHQPAALRQDDENAPREAM